MRAYGVPVVGAGTDTTERLRTRVARGRPNWWVILAVSLALMALLVATAGSTPHRAGHGGGQAAVASRRVRPAGTTSTSGGPSGQSSPPATTTTTTPPKPAAPASATSATSLVSARAPAAGAPTTTVPSVTTTTTTVPAATTTTSPATQQPADRMDTQGYLDPPLQPSNGYGFTGTGAMQISVLWSGTTYLTMTVSCPSGSQSVGGTSAMAASLSQASGSCRATVTEPSSESVALTYTISIGPAGG